MLATSSIQIKKEQTKSGVHATGKGQAKKEKVFLKNDDTTVGHSFKSKKKSQTQKKEKAQKKNRKNQKQKSRRGECLLESTFTSHTSHGRADGADDVLGSVLCLIRLGAEQ